MLTEFGYSAILITMLAIRFKGVGKKHQRSYRLVVGERRSKLHGKFVEDLGWYNPHTKEAGLNADRIKHWLNNGAQPSDTVHNLLITKGVLEGEKRMNHNLVPPKAEEEKPAEKKQESAEAEAAPASAQDSGKAQPAAEPAAEAAPAEEKTEEPKAE